MSQQFSEHWSRWIKASCAKHFSGISDETKFFVEGFVRDTENLPDWVEFRIDGPFIKEHTRESWELAIEINVLISVTEGVDIYRQEVIVGRVTELFLDCIRVYRYGNGPDDDQTELGCLELRKPSNREKLTVSNFGKLRPDTQLTQASVEGHYLMFLD